MLGGGAERVVTLLSNATAEKGYSVSLIITHQSKEDAVLHGIDSKINVISLLDEISNQKISSLKSRLIMLIARLIRKLGFKDNDPKRLIALIHYVIKNSVYQTGESYSLKNDLFDKVSNFVNAYEEILCFEEFEKYLKKLIEKKKIDFIIKLLMKF